MKTYKSSDLTHKRAEVLKEAKANGVIIQECNTNGDVRCEYVLLSAERFTVDKKDIVIEKPIEELGIFEIVINLHSEVTVKIRLWVTKK